MKKIILSAFMLIRLTFAAQAQDISKNALGLRLGGNYDIASEVSYQRRMSDLNRLELGLGWNNNSNVDAFKLTGIYQWVWNIEGNFNWYAGVGGGLGSWSNTNKTNGTFIFASSDVGIEYNFDIPLQFSLDIRPELGILGDYKYTNSNLNALGLNIALGIRYRL
jgi:hypothetical protein